MTQTYNITHHSYIVSSPALYAASYKNKMAASHFYVLHEGQQDKDAIVLETYFNDIYTLFLDKVTRFALHASPAETEEKMLQDLLKEIIKTKKLLQDKDAI